MIFDIEGCLGAIIILLPSRTVTMRCFPAIISLRARFCPLKSLISAEATLAADIKTY